MANRAKKYNPPAKPVAKPIAKAAAKPIVKGKAQTAAYPLPKLELELNQPWFNKYLQASILTILALLLYSVTWNGEYALDDLIVITGNKFTQQGFGGIKNLLFKDSFLGYTGMENQLAGGRYRPLSYVTFAIEYEFFGKNPATKVWLPHFSHSVNILLYGVLIWQLFWFLDKWIFRKRPYAAFIATLIFALHPIHTEIVANIKSRDELMALSFMLLSMDHFFKYFLEKKSAAWVGSAMFFFFLSLISKENGLVYFIIVPLIVYVFQGATSKAAVRSGLPYLGMIIFYVILRAKLTGLNADVQNGEILNAPYLRATAAQAFATKTMLLGKFLYMIFVPYPMSYDYSFDQIKYIKPNDFRFFLSLIVNGFLAIYAFINIRKRSVLAFCILFYFSGIALVSNFFFNVGTAFADRFMFQPSLGLAIWVAYLADKYIFSVENETYKKRFAIISAAALIWAVPSFAYAYDRNKDWLSEYNLFTADVLTCPDSAKTHSNCGVVLINASGLPENAKKKEKILADAIGHLSKALEIHPGFIDAWANLGVAYSRLEDMDKAEYAWMSGYNLSPAHPKISECVKLLGDMFFYKGFKLNQAKDYKASAEAYQKAIKYHYRDSAEAYYNLGGNLLMIQNVAGARAAWQKAIEIKPGHPMATHWLNQISNMR